MKSQLDQGKNMMLQFEEFVGQPRETLTRLGDPVVVLRAFEYYLFEPLDPN